MPELVTALYRWIDTQKDRLWIDIDVPCLYIVYIQVFFLYNIDVFTQGIRFYCCLYRLRDNKGEKHVQNLNLHERHPQTPTNDNLPFKVHSLSKYLLFTI